MCFISRHANVYVVEYPVKILRSNGITLGINALKFQIFEAFLHLSLQKTIDSSDDETSYVHPNGGYMKTDQRWWITRLFMTIVTAVTTTTSEAYASLFGPPQRYRYGDRKTTQGIIIYSI